VKPVRAGALVVGCMVLFACVHRPPAAPSPPPPAEPVRDHWASPQPQGEPPAAWSDLERSLQPEACGACHTAQFEAWKQTRHSRATGPGVLGQLPGMGSAAGASCLSCHAPLHEQQPELARDGAWSANPDHDPQLLQQGVTCAACHVRGWTVWGPPPRDDAPRDMAALPHDGFVVEPLFQSSDFCSPCHQFPEGWRSLEGKLLANTWQEWEASPQGREGITCQGCHMPDRAHHFAGIHDPATTRSAFTIEARIVATDDGAGFEAELVLANTGAGHHAPTYTTPRIEIDFQEIDDRGEPSAEPSEPRVVQRRVVLGDGADRELFDTRIPAGGRSSFAHAARPSEASVGLRIRVRVLPDHHYEGLFEDLLERLPDDSAQRPAIQRALDEARANHYVLHTEELPLPSPAPVSAP
jgi:hypothetical protein